METPREKAVKATQNFCKTIDRFGSALRRSRSNFDKICAHQEHIDDYFLTAIDDLDLEINEDKGLSIKAIRTDSRALKQEMQEVVLKRKQM